MQTFDSFTIVPSYSEIESRSKVTTSTVLAGLYLDMPIINANMHALSRLQMVDVLSRNNLFSSYHRFFRTLDQKKQMLNEVNDKKLFWMSVGTKPEEYEFVDYLIENGYHNILIDVNHGHHKMVGDMCSYVKKKYPFTKLMAGNVSSSYGISYLKKLDVDIIKVGNSFGNVCSTLAQTAVGVHPLHVAKRYREDTGDWNTKLCLDGGIRNSGDIAKSLIWGDLVMLGSMFAGTDESAGELHGNPFNSYKMYYGNASLEAKRSTQQSENDVRYVEGISKQIKCTGKLETTLNSIKEGLQSSFSFVNALNIKEWRSNALENILML